MEGENIQVTNNKKYIIEKNEPTMVLQKFIYGG